MSEAKCEVLLFEFGLSLSSQFLHNRPLVSPLLAIIVTDYNGVRSHRNAATSHQGSGRPVGVVQTHSVRRRTRETASQTKVG